MGTVMSAALGEFIPIRSQPGGRRVPIELTAIAEKCLAAEPAKRLRHCGRTPGRPSSLPGRGGDQSSARHYMGSAVSVARTTPAPGFWRWTYRRLLADWLHPGCHLDCRQGPQGFGGRTPGASVMQEKAQAAELARQAAVAESAARAQRRMQSFRPYAEAIDLLMRGQRFDRAVQLLEEATKTDSEFPKAQFALGEAYRLSGLPNRAATAYLQANELNRKITGRPHLQALLAAGMNYDGSGDYKKAEQAFIQAEREGAGHPLSLVGKAFRLAESQRVKEARGPAEEAVRLGPHLWETHFALGYVMEELAEMGFVPPGPAGSRRLLRCAKALELSPRQAEVWHWLGRALICTDTAANRTEAIRALNRSVALEPANGNRYIGRAMLLISLGEAVVAPDVQKARTLETSRPLLLHIDSMLAARRRHFPTAFRLQGEIIQSKQVGLHTSATGWRSVFNCVGTLRYATNTTAGAGPTPNIRKFTL